MNKKFLALAITAAMFSIAFTETANARLSLNGLSLNGSNLNGGSLNGSNLNGREQNGITVNGRENNGRYMNSFILKHGTVNGIQLQSIKVEGGRLVGIAPQ